MRPLAILFRRELSLAWGGGGGPLLLSALTAALSLASGIGAIGALGFVAAWMFWRWLPRKTAFP